ncbi:hypothetical protein [Tenacibaculum jejuense]|uniref:DUF922 domain-containing protein n=1 Tax=Tenacibaculum jejuense TaxID=584609 RepID=A0A238U8R8_9FLAO|nr:hypothetical protein [Tenacibaculum jejuense]SNR15445.1 Protein of unknown function precursor [Tenacibaculum jejuense]
MNKIVTFFLIFFTLSCIHAQNSMLSDNDSVVLWSKDRPLFWSDFQFLTKDHNFCKDNLHGAGASVGLSISYRKIGNNIRFNIHSKFYKFESYVFKKNNHLLKHEQLHFDIVELYARKLRKQFLLLKKERVSLDDYFLVYESVNKKLDENQDFYDRETQHSLNKEKQKEWSFSIKNKLKKMEPYSVKSYLDSLKIRQ